MVPIRSAGLVGHITTHDEQVGVYHLMDERRPHVSETRRGQPQKEGIQNDGHPTMEPVGLHRLTSSTGGQRFPTEADVVIQLPAEEGGIDVVEGLEHDVVSETFRGIAERLQAVQGLLLVRFPRPSVEIFQVSDGGDGAVAWSPRRTQGGGLEDVYLSLGNGVRGAPGGVDTSIRSCHGTFGCPFFDRDVGSASTPRGLAI